MSSIVSFRSRARSRVDETTTLRTLNTFVVDIIGIPNADDLFWYVAQNVVGRLNFGDCVIYASNEDQTQLRQVAAWGDKNPFGRSILNPLVIPFGDGITGRVAQTRKAIIIDDLLKDQNYIPDTQPARSEICVPLIYRGRVIGVIDSEDPELNAFSEADLEVLSTVAAITSAKLELLGELERSRQQYHDLVLAHTKLNAEALARKALEAELFEARQREVIGRLTGQFAHEFNNLLTVISGNLELTQLVRSDPQSSEYLAAAQSAAARAAKLIRYMLIFSQKMNIRPESTDIQGFVDDFLLKNKCIENIHVRLTHAQSVCQVSIDRKGLYECLQNLILNAQEAMPEGGTLEIIVENVSHTATDGLFLASELCPGRYVRLSIKDSGSGIPRDRLRRIFDPFYTTKVVGSGIGLGLSMVLGFIQKSGGAIGVTSEVERGSSFHLYLPALKEGILASIDADR